MSGAGNTAGTGSFLSGARLVPPHGFSVSSMCRKRFRENTSSLAVTVGFILPTLTAVNKQLEQHIETGTDIAMDEIVDIFVSCGRVCAVAYGDRLARVACQTGLACMLIRGKSSLGDSMVYLWDLYPRLMQRYIGEVFRVLCIPRFFASLLGPTPSAQDVTYLESKATPVDAMTDSLKRNSIFLFGDVVVDTVRIIADGEKKPKEKPAAVLLQAATRATATLCWAAGAAVGRAVAGERGEYFGEYIGTVLSPFVTLQLTLMVRNASRKHRHSRHSHKSAPAAADDATKKKREAH